MGGWYNRRLDVCVWGGGGARVCASLLTCVRKCVHESVFVSVCVCAVVASVVLIQLQCRCTCCDGEDRAFVHTIINNSSGEPGSRNRTENPAPKVVSFPPTSDTLINHDV